jgi:hypothetical protein
MHLRSVELRRTTTQQMPTPKVARYNLHTISDAQAHPIESVTVARTANPTASNKQQPTNKHAQNRAGRTYDIR